VTDDPVICDPVICEPVTCDPVICEPVTGDPAAGGTALAIGRPASTGPRTAAIASSVTTARAVFLSAGRRSR
jgi:hypothetical protein